MKNKLFLLFFVISLTMVVGCAALCGNPSKGTFKKLFNEQVVVPYLALMDKMAAEGRVKSGYVFPGELLSVDAIGRYDSVRRCWPVRFTMRYDKLVGHFEADIYKNSFDEWQLSSIDNWREAPGNYIGSNYLGELK